MNALEVTIEGVSPLITHSARLIDPLDDLVKAIAELTSKGKNKTEADHAEISRLEWLGGLYLNDDGRPCIPEQNLERMLRDAAAKSRQGKQVLAGLMVEGPAALEYDGPKDPDKMWEDGRFLIRSPMRVTTSRVMRTRVIFPVWSATFTVLYNPGIIKSQKAVLGYVDRGGTEVGLGDGRPRYGRFKRAA